MGLFNPLTTSCFELLLVLALLLTFLMVGSRWMGLYITAFRTQSWLIALICVAMAHVNHDPRLYGIAALTFLFRGLILPYLLQRMVTRLRIERDLHSLLPVGMGLLLSAGLVIFAYLVADHLMHLVNQTAPLLTLALMVMLSMVLTSFLLLSIRDEALSKVLALLMFENGVFLGSLFLAPGMPLLIELVLLFDLLIAIMSFGLLIRYLQQQVGSTSTRSLQTLVG